MCAPCCCRNAACDAGELEKEFGTSLKKKKKFVAKFTSGVEDGSKREKIALKALLQSGNDGNDGAGDDDGGSADKSTDTKKKGDGSSAVIIVVVVIFVIIIGSIITVVIIKQNSGAPGDRNVVSFENPMYDTAGRPKQTPAAGQQGGGYQDVQPNAGYTQDGTYAEPNRNGQATNSGYMDVSPTAAGGGGATGYMDVAPNQVSLGGGNDDGEDV